MAFLISLKVVLTFKREPSSPNPIIRFKASKKCRAYFHEKSLSQLIYYLPKKIKNLVKMVETEKEKIICLNCRAYSDHSTGCCPYKKCQLCGKDGHLKIDCLKLQEVSKDWLSHLITYNATIDLPEDAETFDDSKHKEWKELTNDYLLMPPRLHLNY